MKEFHFDMLGNVSCPAPPPPPPHATWEACVSQFCWLSRIVQEFAEAGLPSWLTGLNPEWRVKGPISWKRRLRSEVKDFSRMPFRIKLGHGHLPKTQNSNWSSQVLFWHCLKRHEQTCIYPWEVTTTDQRSDCSHIWSLEQMRLSGLLRWPRLSCISQSPPLCAWYNNCSPGDPCSTCRQPHWRIAFLKQFLSPYVTLGRDFFASCSFLIFLSLWVSWPSWA